jgi:predicted regulator of Ras-like GTPase activity (Roadblock/LC7/MglB family)
MSAGITLHESEYRRIKSILAQAQSELKADLILLIDCNGQQIAAVGARHIDLTALASLAAANVAATDGLARLVGESEFSVLYHQGKHRSIHISEVSKRFSLVLVFDETVSPGMVRWKARRTTASLNEVIQAFLLKLDVRSQPAAAGPGALEFTEEEIEMLFGRWSPQPKR